MVTVAVAAILLMIAVPNFHNLIVSNRLTTSANALIDAVNLARLDAIKLNASTQFCGSTAATNTSDTLGKACGTTAGAVYSLPQGGTAVQVRATPPGITAPLQFAGAGVVALRFSGQGYGYAPSAGTHTPFNDTIAVLCTTDLTSNNLCTIAMSAGSVVTSTSSSGTCP